MCAAAVRVLRQQVERLKLQGVFLLHLVVTRVRLVCCILHPRPLRPAPAQTTQNVNSANPQPLCCCAGGGRSVLDKAVEDRKILEFAGVGKNYSAGIKDEPIED